MKLPEYEMIGNALCAGEYKYVFVSSFSGATCVPLDNQENIICTLHSHIAPHGSYTCEGRVRTERPQVTICEGSSMRLILVHSLTAIDSNVELGDVLFYSGVY